MSAVAFAEGGGAKRAGDGSVVWQDFDQEVLGCHYNFYDPAARQTGSEVWSLASSAAHPVLRGLKVFRFHSSAGPYRVAPVAPDATVILKGRWSDSQPEEPVAWVRDRPGCGRVFYTSPGHPDDFKQEKSRALLANAIQGTLGRKGGKR